jgi:hypothetical protein
VAIVSEAGQFGGGALDDGDAHASNIRKEAAVQAAMRIPFLL